MMESCLSWISLNETLLQFLGATSLLLFIATLLIVGIIVIRMPADYFAYDRKELRRLHRSRHPVVRVIILAMKNIAGILLVLAGLAMLVLPGQGVLTALIGITLLNFPGKRALECRIVRSPRVLSTINRLRARAGKPPLVFSKK